MLGECVRRSTLLGVDVGSITSESCIRIPGRGLWCGVSENVLPLSEMGPLPGMWGSSLEGDLFCSARLRWCLGESAPETHLLGQLFIDGELVAVRSQYRDGPASRGCQPDSLGLQELLGAHEA